MTGLSLVEGKGQVEPLIACFRCGICCTEYQVNLSLAEGQRIADRLELVWEEFLNRYVDKSWPGIKNSSSANITGHGSSLNGSRVVK